MLSIAVFSECYHPMRNGVVVSVSSFSRVLTEMGHHVTIFTARHPEQDAEDDRDESVYRLPSVTFPINPRYPLALPLATGLARKMMAEQHFDLIHSHSPMLVGHVAVAFHHRRNLPLVFTYHTLIEEYTHYVPLPRSWVQRQAVRLSRTYSNSADHIITPTAHVASRLRKYRVTKPITVIPTGIDIDQMDVVPEVDMRARYQIPPDVPLLAYAGRIAREKNIPRLVGAFRDVLRLQPDAHFLLIGGGPCEGLVKDCINASGVAHRTRMTGFVTRQEVVQCLRAADLFVFASTTETQGLVLGEAMACGIPVVAVTSDASRELIASGVEGLLVPDADEPFAEAVLDLLHDDATRQRMQKAARIRAEGISSYRCTEQLVDIYRQVIDSYRGSRHDQE